MALPTAATAKCQEDTLSSIVFFPSRTARIARIGAAQPTWPRETWSGPRKGLVWVGVTGLAWVVTLGPLLLLIRAL